MTGEGLEVSLEVAAELIAESGAEQPASERHPLCQQRDRREVVLLVMRRQPVSLDAWSDSSSTAARR
jgi:hypothetical protein